MSYSFNIHFLSTGSAFATGHVFIELSDGQSRIAFELNTNQNYMGPSHWMLGRNPVPTSFLSQQFGINDNWKDDVVRSEKLERLNFRD